MKPLSNSSSETDLVDALATCLDALAVGSELEAVLNLYPAMAAELRPLLQTAQAAQTLSPTRIPVDAMNRSRTKMLGQAATFRTQQVVPSGLWGRMRRLPRFALSSILTVVVLVASLFTVNAIAASALPGDSLYGLKRSFEGVWLGLTPGSLAQDSLEQAYRERRIDEVRELLALGRVENITFQGVFAARDELSGIAPERWLVSDINVLRTIDTEVLGDIQIGMWIEVEGRTRPDGTVEAIRLRPQAFAFVGVIETMSSDVWQIEGREVIIRTETELAPGLVIGTKVMVLAEFDAEAQIFARAILYAGTPEPTPSPTISPTVDDTQTPPPTETTPDYTPTSTDTSVPLITELPAEETPSPTISPPATSSPEPTPTITPWPTDDHRDDDTPTVKPTDEEEEDNKTKEPDLTDEPDPTDEPEDDSSSSNH